MLMGVAVRWRAPEIQDLQAGNGAMFTPELCTRHMADHAAVGYRQCIARLTGKGCSHGEAT